jgi:hypothetical protein
MVRIGIEASERISLACEAEGVAGPALSATPTIFARSDDFQAGIRLLMDPLGDGDPVYEPYIRKVDVCTPRCNSFA